LSIHPRFIRTNGFSLIELMVGLVIGMVALLVVMQVFSLSEGSRRTTVGGDDAQTGGAIAFTSLQRDIRQAGYGINAPNLIGCSVLLPTGWTVSALAPLTINHASIPAGDANTDTLLVAQGNSSGSPEGDRINAQPSNAVYAVATTTAFTLGDQIIAEPANRPTPCNLTMEPLVLPPADPNVTVGTGVAGMVNGALFNLGQRPQVVAYAVRSGNLTTCDYTTNDCSVAANTGDPTVWVPIGENVVSLRAQYGRDTTAPGMDGVVDVFDQTTPTTKCEWARMRAVRLALVTRSGQYEKTNVTTASPVWAGSIDSSGNPAQPVNLAGLPNWQQYRYKTFETTVPLRNMAWQGAPSGC